MSVSTTLSLMQIPRAASYTPKVVRSRSTFPTSPTIMEVAWRALRVAHSPARMMCTSSLAMSPISHAKIVLRACVPQHLCLIARAMMAMAYVIMMRECCLTRGDDGQLCDCLREGFDPLTVCVDCLSFLDPAENCLECLNGTFLDPASQCVDCRDSALLDPNENCNECKNTVLNPAVNCAECKNNTLLDPSEDCDECKNADLDPLLECTQCKAGEVFNPADCSRCRNADGNPNNQCRPDESISARVVVNYWSILLASLAFICF